MSTQQTPLDQAAFISAFFRALDDAPLAFEVGSSGAVEEAPFYYPIYTNEELTESDPIANLLARLDLAARSKRPGAPAGNTVHVFSGFRGTGKSTELRRLKSFLVQKGYPVAYFDVEDLINLTRPIEIADFLLVIAGAVNETAPDLLAPPPPAPAAVLELPADDARPSLPAARMGWWERFHAWLTETKIEVEQVGIKLGSVLEVKASLKRDPGFRLRLAAVLDGHLGALLQEVRSFVAETVAAISACHGGRPVVLLLDSFEKIRGLPEEASRVDASVASLFLTHADKLRFEGLQVVYSVPPWLVMRTGGLPSEISSAHMIPCLKVREKDGTPCAAGMEAARAIIGRRGDWRRLLGEDGRALDRLIIKSGGHLRDLLRLVESCVVAAETRALPLAERFVDIAINELATTFALISDSHAQWLARVADTHRAELADDAQLPDLARFFDTHMVLCYRNGEPWYDVHPLVVERVRQQLAAAQARATTTP